MKSFQAKPIISHGIRFFIYALSAYLLAELIRFDAKTGSIHTKFSENSLTEYTQSIFLLAASIILFFIYKRSQPRSYLALLLFAFTSASFFREQDVYFENFIGQTSWFIPVLIVVITSFYLVIKNWGHFILQLDRYRNTFSAGLFTSGIITTYLFSRLFGRKVFWYTVMEDHYFRGVKNAAEECLELYGYLFILIAAIEFLMAERKLWAKDVSTLDPLRIPVPTTHSKDTYKNKEPLPY